MIHDQTATAAGVALAVGAVLTGCASEAHSGPKPQATGAYVPQPIMADIASGYMVIRNNGGTAAKLASVTSDISDKVTMHQRVGGTMKPVKSFHIPANGRLELERGGSHLMFMNLKHRPVKGERVAVELRFGSSATIKLNVPVTAATYNPQT